jgi:glycosyltransferase involved in cell wall biosynthesis
VLRVSAIVPCYNGEKYLAEALESIRAQTRPAHELIVVDDGSTDGSATVAESYGATVIRQANLGEGAARNAGIRASSGDAIAWLDADDRWRAQHIEVVAGLLERHSEAVGAFGAVQRFGLDDRLIRGWVPPGITSSVVREAFRDWLHTTIGSIVHREAFFDVGGFDEEERYGVDFDLWLRLSWKHQFVATHEVTSDWRWHSAQQSTSLHRQVAAQYRYRRRFIDRLRAGGDTRLADELEREFAQLWRQQMSLAVRNRDVELVSVLRRSSDLVPDLHIWRRRSWTWASYAPPVVLGPALGVRSAAKRLIAGAGRSAPEPPD